MAILNFPMIPPGTRPCWLVCHRVGGPCPSHLSPQTRPASLLAHDVRSAVQARNKLPLLHCIPAAVRPPLPSIPFIPHGLSSLPSLHTFVRGAVLQRILLFRRAQRSKQASKRVRHLFPIQAFLRGSCRESQGLPTFSARPICKNRSAISTVTFFSRAKRHT